jgi:guanylate kinase
VGKLIVISAPSGSGKTSIVHQLLKDIPALSFSVSASSRERRENEVHGKDYYFLGVEGFQKKIKEDAFLEWEQVYENQYYGTLKSEIERIWSEEKTVIFDVDVLGGLNIKKQYPKDCLSIFILAPSIEVLAEMLIGRGSESVESVKKRLDKAGEEISKNKQFDTIILNNDFETACEQTKEIITNFINA